MTDTNTKVRSLILTALMVVSVFGGSIAFAGAASAATGGSYTVANTATGATTTVTAQIQSEQDAKSVSGVELDFSGDSNFNNDAGAFSTGSSDDYTVTVYDTDGNLKTTVDGVSLSSSNNADTVTLTFSSVTVNAGETLEVVGTNFENPNGDKAYSGSIQFNPSSSGEAASDDISFGTAADSSDETGSTAPSAGGPNYVGPVDVAQSPVEFTASDDTDYTTSSGDNEEDFVEVVFDREADTSGYTFTVNDADGNTVSTTYQDSLSSGQAAVLTLDEDLPSGATLTVTDGNGDTTVDAADITSSSTTVEEDGDNYSGDGDTTTSSYEGERVAVVSDETGESIDVYRYNSASDVDNDYLFTRGTGTDSYVKIIDTGARDDLTSGEDYSLQFLGTDASSPTTDEERLTLRNLGLSADAVSTNVSFTDGSTTISADITSNAVNRPVDVTVFNANDEVAVPSETFSIDADGSITADLTVDKEGNYTIEVEDVDTGITAETDTISVSAVSGEVMFTNNIFSQERGDVAEVTVDLANTDEAVVLVGSNSVNYYTAVTVADAASGDDADNQVTLQLNTFRTTEGGSDVFSDAAFSATGDDSVVSVESPDQAIDSISADDVEANGQTNSPLAASDYNLAAYVGGEEQTVGTLIVNERSATGMNLWTAPASSFDSVAAPAGVYSAIDDGAITQSDEIAAGDTLVHQIQIEGVYGALAAEDTETPEQALINLLTETGTDIDDDGDSTALSLSMVQAGSSPNQDPKRLALSESKDALNVVLDDANNTVFVNVNTADAQFFRGQEGDTYSSGDTLVSASTGETFDVTLTLEPESGLTADDTTEESLSATFEVVERSGEINNGDPVMVEPGTDQVISGETSIAPGTEVTMRARATGDNPFLVSTTTTVAQNGTFEGAFDFSEVSNNTSFTVTASASPQFADGELSAEGTVANTTDEPEDTPTPTPTDMPTDEPTDMPTDTPTDMATDTPSDTEGSTPGFGGAVAIVALAGAALIALRREN